MAADGANGGCNLISGDQQSGQLGGMLAIGRLVAVVLESAARSRGKRPSGSFLSLWPSAACARGVSCVSRAVARVRHCRIGSRRLVA